MQVQITEQHRWLHQLIGEWSFEIECAAPDGTSQKQAGTQTVRKLGDAWILLDDRGPLPASEGGGEALTQMTLGYDPDKGHFVGTFIGSMMTHLWWYQRGTLDADRRRLTLDAEGPSFDGTPGKLANYRDVIEIVGPDERVLRGNLQAADGSWTCFTTARYRRLR